VINGKTTTSKVPRGSLSPKKRSPIKATEDTKDETQGNSNEFEDLEDDG
jgi:hypothetical protein